MKLEPTKAQRKAMAEATEAWNWYSCGPERRLDMVDDMIAAANSIPEGAPVGTIARRPDGKWIAVRTTGDAERNWWTYSYVGELPCESLDTPDADSWPVIFTPGEAVGSGPTTDGGETHDPREPSREELRAYFHQDLAEHCQADEYHEGDKPRLERLMREPSVFDGDADEVEELAKWLSIHIGTWPEDEWELRSKPNYYHDRARELLDFGYRKVSDPTAQQEPERFPGIENPTTADHVGADNADEQLKLIFGLRDIRIERGLSVAFVGEALCLEDAEVERFESGSMNPTMSLIRRYARAVEAVFTVDVRKWEDTQPQQQEPSVYELDRLAMESIRTTAAQQEPATTHPVSPESTNCVPKPRTPRVVDRLGVDEQGSRWRNCAGLEFWHDGTRWVSGGLGGDLYGDAYEPDALPPYTEILEPQPKAEGESSRKSSPRVLPSLDCEEARDGTEWESSDDPDLHYRFHGGQWEVKLLAREWDVCPNPEINTVEFGPYTEVLPDVG